MKLVFVKIFFLRKTYKYLEIAFATELIIGNI